MSKIFSLSFALLIVMALYTVKGSCQNWECIKTNGDYYFGNNQCINSTIRIDSTYITDELTHYINVDCVREYDDCMKPEEPCLTGSDIYSDASGVYCFVSMNGIPVRIESNATPGNTWILYDNHEENLKVQATLESAIVKDILGITDSVKVIVLQAIDSTGNPVSSSINGKEIHLSKNYGLIKLCDFYIFSELINGFMYMPDKELLGMSNPRAGICSLTFREIYDIEIGDIFHINRVIRQSGFVIEDDKFIKVLTHKTGDYLNTAIFGYSIKELFCSTDIIWGTTTCYKHSRSDWDTIDFNALTSRQMNKLAGQARYMTADSSKIDLAQTYDEYGDGFIQYTYSGWPRYLKHEGDTCYLYDQYTSSASKYIKGCGHGYGGYSSHVIESNTDVVYYKKGNLEWGVPFDLTEIFNWQCFKKDKNYYYSSADIREEASADQGIRLSNVYTGGKAHLTNYKMIRQVNDSCFTKDGFSWAGKEITLDNYGNYEIINAADDTLRIYTIGIAGNWQFYKNEQKNLIIKATVAEQLNQFVLGTEDSVRRITFQAYDLNSMPIEHEINNEYLLLSKNHGLLRTFSFYDAPDSLVIYNLVGNDEKGIRNIGMSGIYNINIGDQFHFINKQKDDAGERITKTIRTMLEKEVMNQSDTKFTYRDRSKISQYNSQPGNTEIFFKDTIISQIVHIKINNDEQFDEMPGEPSYFNQDEYNGAYVIPLLESDADSVIYNGRSVKYFQSPVYIQENSGNCYLPLTETCSYYYIEGCGGPYRKCNSEGISESDSLVYYKKGSEEWGTPLNEVVYGIHEMNLTEILNVFPNPATDIISFRLINEDSNDLRLEIYSTMGIKLKTIPFTNNEIILNLQSFKSGLYFYKVSNTQIHGVGKFIKE